MNDNIRLAMAEACLGEIRAMMPQAWASMELPWCILQLTHDKRRLDALEQVLCYAMIRFDGRTAMEQLPSAGYGWANGQLRAAIDSHLLKRKEA